MAKAPTKAKGAAEPLPPADGEAKTGPASGETNEGIEAVVGEAATATLGTEPAAEPTPPAPGDDAEAVHARRMDRLSNLVADAEFESGTALGDMTDVLLELFKARPILWAAMDKAQQRDTVRFIEAQARLILDKVVLVVAQEDEVTIEGTLLAAFGIKGDAVEAKIKIDHIDGESLLDVYRLAGHKVVLLSADSKRFQSRRRDPETPGNQAELAFADAAPKAPTEIISKPPAEHPADDSDLADADDDEEAEPEIPEGDSLFGVFDEGRSEWLIDENGGDDGWTGNVEDAGRWPHEKATEIGRGFDVEGEPPLALRALDPKPVREA